MIKPILRVRNEYAKVGVSAFYKIHKDDYLNPHVLKLNNIIDKVYAKWNLGNKILDLCAGSGEVTLELYRLCYDLKIEGIDPFTYELYKRNTGKECLALSFKEIAIDGLNGKTYDTVICSYALHLCLDSMLPMVLWQLSQVTSQLVVITPHKRPECNNIMGWKEKDRFKMNKITAKLYVVE